MFWAISQGTPARRLKTQGSTPAWTSSRMPPSPVRVVYVMVAAEAVRWGAISTVDRAWLLPAVDAAVQWVRDFHADGLRLDAIQTIYDMGARHFLSELCDAVRSAAQTAGRSMTW